MVCVHICTLQHPVIRLVYLTVNGTLLRLWRFNVKNWRVSEKILDKILYITMIT